MSYPKSGLGFTYQCAFQGVEVARAYPTIPMRGSSIHCWKVKKESCRYYPCSVVMVTLLIAVLGCFLRFGIR